jgi:DNA-nicking Smr family endonuclease
MASAKKPKPKSGSSPFDSLSTLRDQLKAQESAKSEHAKGPAAKQAATGTTRGASASARPAQPHRAPPTETAQATSFAQLMAGVAPFAHDERRLPGPESDNPKAEDPREFYAAQARREEEEARRRLHELAHGNAAFEVVDSGQRTEGRRSDVSPNALRSLRQGQYHLDGELDLHGFSALDAKEAVQAFLAKARSRGARTLLLIHGRGNRTPGGTGVLRGEITAWLSQGPAALHVAAFATARPEDGGEGAVVVLLQR